MLHIGVEHPFEHVAIKLADYWQRGARTLLYMLNSTDRSATIRHEMPHETILLLENAIYNYIQMTTIPQTICNRFAEAQRALQRATYVKCLMRPIDTASY